MRRRPYELSGNVLRPLPRSRVEAGWEQPWERWSALRSRDEVLEAGEIYLELHELNLDDTTAIVAFANRWGPLAISYGRPRYQLLTDVPDFHGIRRQLERTRPAKHAQRKLPGTTAVPESESLDEFRFGARCLRDLTRASQSIQQGADMTATDWEVLGPDRPTNQATHRHNSPSHDFEAILTRGLSPFHPQVHLERERSGTPVPDRKEWTSGGTVPLYATCCLELYNHLAQNATYRYCANQTCQRLYVRQTGRAEHGQHRQHGTLYCSTHCARAQAQRNYRTRQRQH